MQRSVSEEYVTISFETDEDMDRAFHQLVHNSNSEFIGLEERTIAVTKEQLELLHSKNIMYTIIE
jgi:hypothetical protein